MSSEEVETLLAENAALQADVAVLRPQLAELKKQLQAALARIAELEQAKIEPPAFVKPNRPVPTAPKASRKKRAPQHNTSLKRSQPTRIERHALS